MVTLTTFVILFSLAIIVLQVIGIIKASQEDYASIYKGR